MSNKMKIFYMMNGMHILAEVTGKSDKYISIKNGVALMIQPDQQNPGRSSVAMMNAFPYTEPDTELNITRSQITASSDISWNTGMIKQFDDFWTQLKAKASGIILPGKGAPPLKVV
jgi:sRNA-binding regulator protein Hfq